MSDKSELADTAKKLSKFIVPSIGTGISRTSTTYIVMFLLMERDRWCQLEVILSVFKQLEISLEELNFYAKRPDCIDEEVYEKWSAEYEALKKRLGVKQA